VILLVRIAGVSCSLAWMGFVGVGNNYALTVTKRITNVAMRYRYLV